MRRSSHPPKIVICMERNAPILSTQLPDFSENAQIKKQNIRREEGGSEEGQFLWWPYKNQDAAHLFHVDFCTYSFYFTTERARPA